MILFQATKIANAINREDTERLRELLAKGANPDAYSEYERLPLERAVHRGNGAAVEVLIAFNASRQTNWDDGTLLHMAARGGDVAIATALLAKWPEMIGEKDQDGYTPLHYAAHHGHAEMVTFLIDRGIDPALKNRENRTALFLAQKSQHQDVMDILQAFQEKMPAPKPPMPQKIAVVETPEPPPAGVGVAPGWYPLAEDRIARVTVEAPIGYRLTEIFNFKVREQVKIYHNLDTKVETSETRSFDDVREQVDIEEAVTQLRASGRKIDVGSISGLRKS